jgi:hypothetical protein
VIEVLSRAVLARWEDLRLPGPRPTRLTFLLDAGDERRHGCARFRAFRDADPRPIFRGKIPRDGVARREVLAEQETLTALAEVSSAATGRLFPRPLFVQEHGAHVATGETLLAGRAPTEPATVLDAGARWLASLWQATEILEGAEAAIREPYLRAALSSVERTPPGGARRLLEAFADELEGRDGTTRCAFGHGDLRAARLRVAGDGSVGALDWEAGGRRRPPWHDAVSLGLDVALRGVRPGAWTESDAVDAFRAGFLGESALARSIRAFLARTFERGGVPPEDLRLAVPATALLGARQAERTGDREVGAWGYRAIALAALVPETAAKLAQRVGAGAAA